MARANGRWIAAVLGCATLFVVGGMRLSAAHAPIAPAPAAPPIPFVRPAQEAPPVAPPPVAPPPATVAPAAYTVRRILDIPGPMRPGDHVWDEAGVPAGRVVITVDLAAQTLSVFRAGYEIGAAVIIYGADDKPTPLGVFRITEKDADHVSNLYDAAMPYMLRLTDDGISIHASAIGRDLATHGCIGLPLAFAKRVFGAVAVGDEVIVTRGETLAQGTAIAAVR